MSDSGVIPLEEVEIPQLEEYPVTESVKLHGPPGTGKTTKSAARVGRLLKNHDYDLRDVAWCTYRTALADDTLQRLHEWELVDEWELRNRREGATKLIGTAHALGYRLCNGLGDPVEPKHQAAFCAMQDIPFQSPEPWMKTRGELLFDTFYWLKKNLYDPSDSADVVEAPSYEALQNRWPGVDVPEQWARWTEYKREKDVIDYHEMLEKPLERRMSPGTPILVIDEYHDAYPLLAKLAMMWMEDSEIVIVAGDPNQVVNSFDGATPEFFEAVDLPKILLEESYRVPEGQMTMAEAVLSNAHHPPAISPKSTMGDVREYISPAFRYTRDLGWEVPTRGEEGSPGWLVDKYGEDMMFLARTKQQVAGIGAALEEAGILYTSQEDLGGWNTDEAATRRELFNALQKIRGLSPGDFSGWNTGFDAFHGDGDRSVSTAVELEAEEAAELMRLTKSKYHAESRSKMNERASRLRDTGSTLRLRELDKLVEPEFWRVYSQGANSVSNLNKTGGMQEMDTGERRALVRALNRYGESVDVDDISVQALTMHASKGQEAAEVVVYDGVTRTIRQGVRLDDTAEANEWRTWYVALTRASERVHLVRDAFDWTSSFLPGNLLTKTRRLVADGGEQ
ncbi:UvrD-helicase domain-containing protein [Haloarchaeobius sp. DT45]|uniref:UvrD-helicase domain-containing protein n=1 Tax=Haloarchaeobius sp. DT45 TaxID=3446116 RepID=UPI003F6CB695